MFCFPSSLYVLGLELTDKIDEDRGKIGENEKDMPNEKVEERESGEEEQDNTQEKKGEDRETGEETKDKRNEKNDGMNVFILINFKNLHAF